MAFNFSTEGVSGSCMKMILSAALGNLSAATIVAPLYWDVSYSLDGSTFTRFDTVPIRTLVYWAGPQWYVPGLYEVDFDLPSACFGQKDSHHPAAAGQQCVRQHHGRGQRHDDEDLRLFPLRRRFGQIFLTT